MSAIDVTRQTMWELLPEVWLVLVAATGMTLAAFLRAPRRFWAVGATVALGVALVLLLASAERPTYVYASPILGDAFSWFARFALVLSGFLLVAMAHNQIDDERAGEFFTALLFVLTGAMIVATANEMVVLFLGLELVSIPTYFLLYLTRRDNPSREAATKYFFLSLLSSGLFLFGMAYLYGLAGTSNLKALAYLIANLPELVPGPNTQFGLIAVLFLMTGLAFRVAAVPLHFYAPDVYQGAPMILTALLSWVPKVVGFLAMIRLLTAVVGGPGLIGQDAVAIAWIFAATTMTLGNCLALVQVSIKRLFAYSSIAHAGFLMMGITAAFANDPLRISRHILGGESILLYLVAYGLMTLGAFASFLLLSPPREELDQIEDLTGLGHSHPWTAAGLAICLLSLAGIPPTLGFWGKFEVFGSLLAVSAQATQNPYGLVGPNSLMVLAVIAAVNAAIAAYYYLRIIVLMFLRPLRPEPFPFPAQGLGPWPTLAVLAVCAVLSLGLGLVPSTIASRARVASQSALVLPDPTIIPEIASPPIPPQPTVSPNPELDNANPQVGNNVTTSAPPT